MLICMKPTDKQLEDIKTRIAMARRESALSDAEIGRMSDVHPSQVSRICGGSFRTISNNVMQICTILGVATSQTDPGSGGEDPALDAGPVQPAEAVG